jgi:hypothetical protein
VARDVLACGETLAIPASLQGWLDTAFAAPGEPWWALLSWRQATLRELAESAMNLRITNLYQLPACEAD